jgi:trehalose 6-phosphate synthase/phosphatase
LCSQEADDKKEATTSMVVVSEFVGCSPSVSGAIRVNPWSIDSVADGIYTAIQMPAGDRHLRHEKHWRYISGHTVGYWAQVLALVVCYVRCSVFGVTPCR